MEIMHFAPPQNVCKKISLTVFWTFFDLKTHVFWALGSKNMQNTVKEIFLDFLSVFFGFFSQNYLKKGILKKIFYSNRTSNVLHDFGGPNCTDQCSSPPKFGEGE